MWKRGITLITRITRRWTKEQIAKNNLIEQALIFQNFSADDLGCSRNLVCTMNTNNSDYEKNAKLVSAAPDMLEALQNIENDNNSIPMPTWNMVQNAIKKATVLVAHNERK